MKNVIQMMCLAAIVVALASTQVTAAPSYSLVSQERRIDVEAQTGPVLDSDSAAAPDTGPFDESRHVDTGWLDQSLGEYITAVADASQTSTIAPTVLTADLRADASQLLGFGSGEATSLYKIVFDIPASRPATLTVELSIDMLSSPVLQANVELSGVDSYSLNEAFFSHGFGTETFNITRDYNLAPGRYTFLVEAEVSVAGTDAGGASEAYAQLTIIPEPVTAILMVAGLPVLLKLRRRRS